MVSYLCDICLGRYPTKDLAEECSRQEIPEAGLVGGWVKYKDNGSILYGKVGRHSIFKNAVEGDYIRNKVEAHKLLYEIAVKITEVPHNSQRQDNQSEYWESAYTKMMLEDDCIRLSPKEVNVIELLVSKVEFHKGMELPSVEFLCQQADFKQLMNSKIKNPMP